VASQPQRLTVTRRTRVLSRPFTTAHGVKITVDTVVAEISDRNSRGRGEGAPLRRYDEGIDGVVATIDAMKGAIVSGLNRETLQHAMPPSAARNVFDCSFCDIRSEARLLARRRTGRAWRGGPSRDSLHPRYSGKLG
jgi:hypothetical protein